MDNVAHGRKQRQREEQQGPQRQDESATRRGGSKRRALGLGVIFPLPEHPSSSSSAFSFRSCFSSSFYSPSSTLDQSSFLHHRPSTRRTASSTSTSSSSWRSVPQSPQQVSKMIWKLLKDEEWDKVCRLLSNILRDVNCVMADEDESSRSLHSTDPNVGGDAGVAEYNGDNNNCSCSSKNRLDRVVRYLSRQRKSVELETPNTTSSAASCDGESRSEFLLKVTVPILSYAVWKEAPLKVMNLLLQLEYRHQQQKLQREEMRSCHTRCAESAVGGCESCSSRLLTSKALFWQTDSTGGNALHMACIVGTPAEIVNQLVKFGGPRMILTADRNGYLPLHYAVISACHTFNEASGHFVLTNSSSDRSLGTKTSTCSDHTRKLASSTLSSGRDSRHQQHRHDIHEKLDVVSSLLLTFPHTVVAETAKVTPGNTRSSFLFGGWKASPRRGASSKGKQSSIRHRSSDINTARAAPAKKHQSALDFAARLDRSDRQVVYTELRNIYERHCY